MVTMTAKMWQFGIMETGEIWGPTLIHCYNMTNEATPLAKASGDMENYISLHPTLNIIVSRWLLAMTTIHTRNSNDFSPWNQRWVLWLSLMSSPRTRSSAKQVGREANVHMQPWWPGDGVKRLDKVAYGAKRQHIPQNMHWRFGSRVNYDDWRVCDLWVEY